MSIKQNLRIAKTLVVILLLVSIPLTYAKEFIGLDSKIYNWPKDVNHFKEGEIYKSGNHFFKYYGRDYFANHIWGYKTLDGVIEIIQTKPNHEKWDGFLGSSFNLVEENITPFDLSEVLSNYYINSDDAHLVMLDYLEAAKKLSLPGELPFFIDSDFQEDYQDNSSKARYLRYYQNAAYEKVKKLGANIDNIYPSSEGNSCPDYYNNLVKDGYLDVAVIGGNLDDQALKFMLEFKDTLIQQQNFIPLSEHILTKEVKMKNRDVIVRIRFSATTKEDAPDEDKTRALNVSNMIQGIAHADVIIYHGHSNYLTGNYYLDEEKSRMATFKMGLISGKRLGRSALKNKAYNVGKKYQLYLFNSCVSYKKYAKSVAEYFETFHNDMRDRPGVAGNGESSFFTDFAPRMAKMIELLTMGACPLEITQTINALKVFKDTPYYVLRGFLQPRNTYIIPEDIEIDLTSRKEDRNLIVKAKGNDDNWYLSTEVFNQDNLGDVVQILQISDNTLYALYKSGRMFYLNPNTQGTIEESSLTQQSLIEPQVESPKEDIDSVDEFSDEFIQIAMKKIQENIGKQEVKKLDEASSHTHITSNVKVKLLGISQAAYGDSDKKVIYALAENNILYFKEKTDDHFNKSSIYIPQGFNVSVMGDIKYKYKRTFAIIDLSTGRAMRWAWNKKKKKGRFIELDIMPELIHLHDSLNLNNKTVKLWTEDNESN